MNEKTINRLDSQPTEQRCPLHHKLPPVIDSVTLQMRCGQCDENISRDMSKEIERQTHDHKKTCRYHPRTVPVMNEKDVLVCRICGNIAEERRVATIFCQHHPDAVLIEDLTAGDMICPECGQVVGGKHNMVNVKLDPLLGKDMAETDKDLQKDLDLHTLKGTHIRGSTKEEILTLTDALFLTRQTARNAVHVLINENMEKTEHRKESRKKNKI